MIPVLVGVGIGLTLFAVGLLTVAFGIGPAEHFLDRDTLHHF